MVTIFVYISCNPKVDDGQPGYPRPIGKWWFGCDQVNFKSSSRPSGSLISVDRPYANDRQADLLDVGKSYSHIFLLRGIELNQN